MNEWIKNLCKGITERAKQKPYKWGFWGIVIMLILFPLLVWVLYLIGDNCCILINTSLPVGEALGFYGAILSFVGTVSLGIVTLVQNTRATKISQTTFDEQQRAQLPVIRVEKTKRSSPDYDMSTGCWNIGETYSSDTCFELQDGNGGVQMGYYLCAMKNISGFPILKLRAIKCCVHDIGKINFLKFTPVFLSSMSLADGETKEICIKLISQTMTHPGLTMDRLQIDTTFECYNPQRRRTEFTTTVLIHDSRIEVLNDQIIPKYKEATTDDKT